MHKLCLFLSVCALCSMPNISVAFEVNDKAALQEIENRLQIKSQMIGKFEQKKSLPQLPHLLLSNGILAISDKYGISWRVQEPIPSHLILDGRQASDDPLTKQIAYPLLHILRGDFSELDKLFEISTENNKKYWQLRLLPKSEMFNKIITQIEITGNRKIEKIRLIEANSAVTEMLLYDLHSVDVTDPLLVAEFPDAQAQ
ncbi:LolA family protein [Microbulbifer sp. 2201CG32-9]|uniref:LolA family protein n=1 Tax=Microbulbifer sp. 2201CG32-9 TaxID=3232309 RepID=UPI00345B9C09